MPTNSGFLANMRKAAAAKVAGLCVASNAARYRQDLRSTIRPVSATAASCSIQRLDWMMLAGVTPTLDSINHNLVHSSAAPIGYHSWVSGRPVATRGL